MSEMPIERSPRHAALPATPAKNRTMNSGQQPSPRSALGLKKRAFSRLDALSGSKGAEKMYKKGEPVPVHGGEIRDLDEWLAKLQYNPREVIRKRSEVRQAEAKEANMRRRRASAGAVDRKLRELGPALRTEMGIFVSYLLNFNPQQVALLMEKRGGRQLPLTREGYLQLKTLFELLDTDKSGTLTFDELRRAANELEFGDYNRASFSKLDTNKSGSLDFLEMIQAFFPHLSLKYITKLHREFSKNLPNDRSLTAMERLPPGILLDIEQQRQRFERKGGATVENMLADVSEKKMTPKEEEQFRELFALYDKDGDGVLGPEEFVEWAKVLYPPYCAMTATHYKGLDEFSLVKFFENDAFDVNNAPLPKLPVLVPTAARIGELEADTTASVLTGAGDKHSGLSARTAKLLQRYCERKENEQQSGEGTSLSTDGGSPTARWRQAVSTVSSASPNQPVGSQHSPRAPSSTSLFRFSRIGDSFGSSPPLKFGSSGNSFFLDDYHQKWLNTTGTASSMRRM